MDDEEFEFGEDVSESFLSFLGEPTPPPFRRAKWQDVPVLGIGFLYNLAEAVTKSLADAHNLAAWHANFFVQQDEFHEQAAREIETMIAGDENG